MKKLKFIRANKTKFGGAEVYLSRLSDQLNKIGIEHELIHSNIPKFLFTWFRVILFNQKVCKNKGDDFYFSLDRITCPDIYRAGDGVHKAFLKIEKKSKFNPLHLVYLYIEKKTFNNAKKIIAISNMVKEDIIKSYNIEEKKIEIIYNGINLIESDYKSSYKKISKEFDLNEKTKKILYVGSGYKRKGVEEFLIILSKLEYEDFKAFIIGKEKKIEYYKNKAKELGIENKVIFTGPRVDVNDFYTISDIFLFPTRYEPFGNVILEAMNFNNVVITTKQCGGGELLNPYFIMENSNDFSISKRIDQILNDEKQLDIIKKENKKIVKNYSIEENVSKTLEIIQEVVNIKE